MCENLNQQQQQQSLKPQQDRVVDAKVQVMATSDSGMPTNGKVGATFTTSFGYRHSHFDLTIYLLTTHPMPCETDAV